MRTAKNNTDHSHSDKQIYVIFYRKTILEYYNLSFSKFVKLSQERRLELSVKVLPTTAKVVAKAFKIPTESLCRRKRKLETAGKLQPSRKKAVCPFTGEYAFLLTTDETLFTSKYFGYV